MNTALSMPHLPDMHWLWLFGATSLGIALGWLIFRPATVRWTDRPIYIAAATGTIGVILVIARLVPIRYGYWLETAAVLAVLGAIGGFVGWALRDLADFLPPATAPAAPGSYLFRDALAGTSTGSAYMRDTTGRGGPARVRTSPSADVFTQAPAPGGYTFPKTLPFADAPTLLRSEATTRLRRHWTWPAQSATSPAAGPEEA